MGVRWGGKKKKKRFQRKIKRKGAVSGIGCNPYAFEHHAFQILLKKGKGLHGEERKRGAHNSPYAFYNFPLAGPITPSTEGKKREKEAEGGKGKEGYQRWFHRT